MSSAPLRSVRWPSLLSVALLLPLLANLVSGQSFDEQMLVQDLKQRVSGLSLPALQSEALGWQALVSELNESEASARDSATDEASTAAADLLLARRDAAAARLLVVVRAVEAQGGSMPEARAMLIEIQGVGAEGLSVDTLAALGKSWFARGRRWVEDELPGLVVRILSALLVLLVFQLLASLTRRLVAKALSSAKLRVSDMLRNFFVGVASKVVFLMGLLFALSTLGVNLGPVLAGVGVAGFVIGFALQDTLANFAAGIMILLYRPFQIGHFITAAGSSGKVAELSLVSTTLHTPDNQVIVIPNGKVWGGIIVNVTAQASRRVDLVVGISYGDDIDKALDLCKQVVAEHALVLKEPAPAFFVANLGDSSVDLAMRPWCKTADYFTVAGDLRKAIKQRFDKEGVHIPFPQRDVHLFQQKS